MTKQNQLNSPEPFAVTVGGTGVTAIDAYSIVAGNPTATGIVTLSTGTAGQLLMSNGATTLPGFTASTYPSSTTINQILYASAANTVTGLATANSGVLVTSSTGVPSILAGGTTGQMLQASTAGTPTWSTSTYPATNAINTLLYASSANVMAALATANSGVLVTSAGGVPSISSTLPSGLTIPLPLISGATSGSFGATGNVGQVISTTTTNVSGQITLSNNTVATVVSVSLTAGNWLLLGQNNGTFAAVVSNLQLGISSVSNTLGSFPSAIGGSSSAPLNLATWAVISISGSATYYLNVESGFASTAPVIWGSLFAIRLP